jgi:hypothetical protein
MPGFDGGLRIRFPDDARNARRLSHGDGMRTYAARLRPAGGYDPAIASPETARRRAPGRKRYQILLRRAERGAL